jgi:hypothetical protein
MNKNKEQTIITEEELLSDLDIEYYAAFNELPEEHQNKIMEDIRCNIARNMFQPGAIDMVKLIKTVAENTVKEAIDIHNAFIRG